MNKKQELEPFEEDEDETKQLRTYDVDDISEMGSNIFRDNPKSDSSRPAKTGKEAS